MPVLYFVAEGRKMKLERVKYLEAVIPGMGRAGAYLLARAHPEWTVRVGRRIYVHPEKLAAWIDAGGAALPGGWRREAPGTEAAQGAGSNT